MKVKVFLGIQIIVGILLIGFGLNKFLGFISMPPPAMELKEFMGAIIKTGYLYQLIGAIQALAGLSFVLNKFVPLMAIIVAIVMLNAVLATLFLAPASMLPATVILILIIVVMVKSQDAYKSLLKA